MHSKYLLYLQLYIVNEIVKVQANSHKPYLGHKGDYDIKNNKRDFDVLAKQKKIVSFPGITFSNKKRRADMKLL